MSDEHGSGRRRDRTHAAPFSAPAGDAPAGDAPAGDAAAFIRRTRTAREAEETCSLAPAAQRSRDTRGRARPETPDTYRTAFERDRDRIVHSKAFRRLKHKTQVFIDPDGDHFITRLSHTLQVHQIARSLARALSLNEPLAEAIALGHDVGHTPFGHTGEAALSPYFPMTGGWHHAAQSVRVYDVLEDLNLTWEVRDGIRAHSWRVEPPPATQEAMCVRYADRIAYLTHDALDAVRAGVLAEADLPGSVRARFGPPGKAWIGEMIEAVIDQSLRGSTVHMEPDTLAVMHELRDFMFQRVYLSPQLQVRSLQAVDLLRRLMDWHLTHPDEVPASYRDTRADAVTQVADYIAGMTDRFAARTYERVFRSPGIAEVD